MAKCDCGCGNEADRTVSGDEFPELVGAHYRMACLDEALAGKGSLSFAERLRVRRAQKPIGVTSSGEPVFGAGSSLEALTTLPKYADVYREVTRKVEDAMRAAMATPIRAYATERDIEEMKRGVDAVAAENNMRLVVDPENDIMKTKTLKGRMVMSPQFVEAVIGFTPPIINCLSCASPATHGNHCVYCEHRREREPIGYTGTHADFAAKRRNKLAFEREKPSCTATSRELAKPHPSTWPSQDGEL